MPTFMIASHDCSTLPAEFMAGSATPQVEAENGAIYRQAFPAKSAAGGSPAVELHYDHLWKEDCGLHGHPLDTEHVAVLVQPAGILVDDRAEVQANLGTNASTPPAQNIQHLLHPQPLIPAPLCRLSLPLAHNGHERWNRNSPPPKETESMPKVRNITVAVSPELYRQTRRIATDSDTTVSELVRHILVNLPELLRTTNHPAADHRASDHPAAESLGAAEAPSQPAAPVPFSIPPSRRSAPPQDAPKPAAPLSQSAGLSATRSATLFRRRDAVLRQVERLLNG